MFLSEIPTLHVLIIHITVLVLLVLALIFFVIKGILVKRKKKMFQAIEGLLNEYVKADPLYAKLDRVNMPEYDYILTTRELKLYIMVIPNFTCGEICINAPTKWQFRRTYKDDIMRFVPRVDKLMRFDPPSEVGLRCKRLYIIYPNSKSLLRYINEFEMEFVRPETDLNGTSVVTYQELLEHRDSIEL